jgi:hypothetical protein
VPAETWPTYQGSRVSFTNDLDPGGAGLPVDPVAIPGPGSLVLFGGGAVGMVGYTLNRLRERRHG